MRVAVNPYQEESSLSVIKSELEKQFPPELIRQRKGSHGATLDYIEGWAIIQRLNNAFNIDWSFTIQEWKVLDHDIIVLGRLSAKGIVKDAFGGASVTINSQTNKVVDLGSDVKAAATDSLKKCATLLGVGLHLYQEKEVKPAQVQPIQVPVPPEEPQHLNTPDGNGGNGNGRITAKQISYVFSLAKDKKIDNAGVKTVAFQRYNKAIEFLSKGEAHELIGFLKSA
jgi:hypothetical protein